MNYVATNAFGSANANCHTLIIVLNWRLLSSIMLLCNFFLICAVLLVTFFSSQFYFQAFVSGNVCGSPIWSLWVIFSQLSSFQSHLRKQNYTLIETNFALPNFHKLSMQILTKILILIIWNNSRSNAIFWHFSEKIKIRVGNGIWGNFNALKGRIGYDHCPLHYMAGCLNSD